MMNSRRVFMGQPRAPDPQFMNFIRTRFCSSQIAFPPGLQQQNFQYPYLRQIQPYTQRYNEYGYHGMSDGQPMQQQTGVFWNKFRDIRKRAQEYNDSEVQVKNMRRTGLENSCEKDPADNYQSRPKWKKTNYGKMTGRGGDGHLFSICSYNILAQNLLEMHPDLYTHCMPQYLDWEYRKKNLLKELKNTHSDIFCLQEVQEEHFLHIFKPELRKLGFSCVFTKRTGDKLDGCAIFYRDKFFQLETCRSVEYFHPHVQLLNRDNIGQIVILKSKLVACRLCIANTHLLFNPRRGDVKLAQLSNLFAEIDKVAYETTERGAGHCPIILCGDFNSRAKSPLYNFIEYSTLDYSDMMSGEVCKPSADDSNPWRSKGARLYVPLLPTSVGISESCQYMQVIEQRRALQSKSTEAKEKTENEVKIKHEIKAERQQKTPVVTCELPQQKAATSGATTEAKDTNEKGPTQDNYCENSSKDAGQSAVGSTSSPERMSGAIGGDEDTKEPAGAAATLSSTDGTIPSRPPTSSSADGTIPSRPPTSSSADGTIPSRPPTSSSIDGTILSRPPSAHPPTGRLHHNLNIESAYQTHNGFVTTHHTRTNCVVDFIFSSRQRTNPRNADLKRVAWLPLFTNEDADNMGGLPNKHWSSDHYRLQVKFMLRPPNNTEAKTK